MKNKTLGLTLIAAVAAVSMVGCNQKKEPTGAYVPTPRPKIEAFNLPAGQEKTIFPMAEGNTWVYELTAGGQDDSGRSFQIGDELVFTMTKVEEKPEGTYGTIEIARVNKETKARTLTDRQIWMINDKGLYQIQIGVDKPLKFEPMQPVLEFPLEAGKNFKWTGKGPVSGAYGESNLDTTIEAPIDVDAADETFNAIGATQSQKWVIDNRPGQMRTTSWWVPKVGLVRLFQQAVGVGGATLQFKLKSKTLKP